ncbi:hypothetical protein [Humibacter sp.]|jgi:hypothetical protein|uniref:hypothetical protein n=1 Tax=Humibacter sp. TaxID=1940291 RepID=UPI002B7B549B|nr:hypothetical protein [Humibacter sp.]HVX06703.1 hypothetical protein [Humibacter sp.]
MNIAQFRKLLATAAGRRELGIEMSSDEAAVILADDELTVDAHDAYERNSSAATLVEAENDSSLGASTSAAPRRWKGWMTAATVGIGVVLVVAIAATVSIGSATSAPQSHSAAKTGTHHAEPRKTAAAAADPCDKYSLKQAYDSCKSGDLTSADKMQSDYDNGTGTYAPTLPGVGSTLTNSGATITVTGAADASTVTWNNSYFRQGSGNETYIDKPPAAGNKFFIVTATVTNSGTDSMDMTCSLPVEFKAVSANHQNFDPIDDLYNVKSNPECNHLLEPESSEPMTWVFEVPNDADIVGAYFYATFTTASQAQIFTFDKNYSITAGT